MITIFITFLSVQFQISNNWKVIQWSLSKISQKYDLYVSTLGVKVYADRVVTQINPDQKLLHKSRVLSRDDLQKACNTSFFKANNLRHLFPNGESMVLMIDDRADVWRKRKNCIHVPKYHFWKDVGDINDPHLAQDFKKTRKPGEKRPKPAKQSFCHKSSSRKCLINHFFIDLKT